MSQPPYQAELEAAREQTARVKAKRAYVETMFGKAYSPGQLKAQVAGAAGASAAAAATVKGAAFGPWATGGMLIAGAVDLFGNVIPSIFRDKPDPQWAGGPSLEERFPGSEPGTIDLRSYYSSFTPAQAEEMRARDSGFGLVKTGAGTVDVFTGKVTYETQQDVQPPAPAPSPPSTRDPTRYGYPDLPSEGGGDGGNMLTAPLSIVGDVLSQVGDLAVQTAPIWTSFLPRARTVSVPSAPTTGATMPYPYATMPGAGPVYLPGASPAFGIPGVDLAPSGSTPITPGPSGRLPSSVKVDYVTPCGRPAWTVYRNMGRPTGYTGDRAAVRRVKNQAKQARKALGGRR